MVTATKSELEDVLAWFTGDIDGRLLFARIKALRADSNWRVLFIPSPTLWDVSLVYWPTGRTYRYQLRPTGDSTSSTWRVS